MRAMFLELQHIGRDAPEGYLAGNGGHHGPDLAYATTEALYIMRGDGSQARLGFGTTEPLAFNGEPLFMGGDFIMIGV